MKDNHSISTDKNELDINVIHQYLSYVSYWAKGRSIDFIKKSIHHSLCFGVYDRAGGQVGFARFVTDHAVFAWIMDVFIFKGTQGGAGLENA